MLITAIFLRAKMSAHWISPAFFNFSFMFN